MSHKALKAYIRGCEISLLAFQTPQPHNYLPTRQIYARGWAGDINDQRRYWKVSSRRWRAVWCCSAQRSVGRHMLTPPMAYLFREKIHLNIEPASAKDTDANSGANNNRRVRILQRLDSLSLHVPSYIVHQQQNPKRHCYILYTRQQA